MKPKSKSSLVLVFALLSLLLVPDRSWAILFSSTPVTLLTYLLLNQGGHISLNSGGSLLCSNC